MPSWKICSAQLEGRVGRETCTFLDYFEITGVKVGWGDG